MADRGRSWPCKKNPGPLGSQPGACPRATLVDREARDPGQLWAWGSGHRGLGMG